MIAGRSLLCIAHQIAAESHSELLGALMDADEILAEQKPLDENAKTLLDEALEMLRGPRPNYGEAESVLNWASDIDGRCFEHWRVVEKHHRAALEKAFAMIIEAAEREDVEQLRASTPKHREAVN